MVAVSIISSIPSAQDSGISTHLARDTPATRDAAECWSARSLATGRPKNKTDKTSTSLVQEKEHKVLQQRESQTKERCAGAVWYALGCDMTGGAGAAQPTYHHPTKTRAARLQSQEQHSQTVQNLRNGHSDRGGQGKHLKAAENGQPGDLVFFRLSASVGWESPPERVREFGNAV